jgi:phthalate 4,5-cis-dihydrodiol dehydrogenase
MRCGAQATVGAGQERGKMSDAKRRVLGIGIVGIGGAAVNMLPALARNPEFAIAAAADIDADVLGRFAQDYPAAATFRSVAELCAAPAVDLVYIGTPTRLHAEHAGIALAARKHVLIEKPMAVTLAEADAMIAAAERNGVLLGVNVKHSFEPRVLKLRALAQSGEFGRLRMIHSWRYVDWLYRPRTRDELTPGWGAGILWRQGPHHFDFLRTIGGGLLRSVRGNCQILDAARRVTGAYTAYLEFADGLVCTAMCSGYDHFNSRDLVRGFSSEKPLAPPAQHARARRALEAHAGDPSWEEKQAADERYGGGGPVPDNGHTVSSSWLLSGPLVASFERGDVRFSPTGLVVDGDREQWEIPLKDQGDGRDGRLKSFHRAIVEGAALSADGRWGKATQEVLVALERSAETHAEIALIHQTPYTG